MYQEKHKCHPSVRYVILRVFALLRHFALWAQHFHLHHAQLPGLLRSLWLSPAVLQDSSVWTVLFSSTFPHNCLWAMEMYKLFHHGKVTTYEKGDNQRWRLSITVQGFSNNELMEPHKKSLTFTLRSRETTWVHSIRDRAFVSRAHQSNTKQMLFFTWIDYSQEY